MLKCCFKLFLILINLVFLVIGIVLTGAGIILVFYPDVVLKPAYTAVKAAAGNSFSLFASADEMSNLPFINELGILLMILGIILTVISFLGVFGSCCCSCCKYLLLVFGIVMIIFVVVEIIVFSLFLARSSPVHSEIKAGIVSEIPKPWNDRGNDTMTYAINLINYNFDCCGINGLQDFTSKPYTCQTFTKGCYDKFQDLMADNMIYIGLSVAGLLLLQVIEAGLAFYCYRDSNKVSPI